MSDETMDPFDFAQGTGMTDNFCLSVVTYNPSSVIPNLIGDPGTQAFFFALFGTELLLRKSKFRFEPTFAESPLRYDFLE